MTSWLRGAGREARYLSDFVVDRTHWRLPYSGGCAMIGWEKRVLLRHYLEKGMSKTAVAKQLVVSRRTVHYWIETRQLDRDVSEETVGYRIRPPVPTKLDPYKSIILSRLAEYPALTAMRLFEEIKASGYAGCYTQVKEYVRKVRPRAPKEPVVRFGDATRSPGSGRLRRLSAALGQTVRVPGCAGVFARPVAAVLHSTDDAACLRGPRGGV